MGADCSIVSATCGSLLNVAVNAPKIPREGFAAKIISNGKNPRTITTAKRIPHVRNHFLALFPIVERTSALITALSILETISKRESPATTKIIERISILIIIAKTIQG